MKKFNVKFKKVHPSWICPNGIFNTNDIYQLENDLLITPCGLKYDANQFVKSYGPSHSFRNIFIKFYTSEDILRAEDLYQLQNSFSSSGIPFQYKMTPEEISWYHVIKNKYYIAEWITENADDEMILTFDDPFNLSQTLRDDTMAPKAAMLSDETALQRLFFWLYNED
jgi:hypothetical protein